MNKGFTIIETILYIALFSIIMTGGFVTAYQLIQSADILNSKTVTMEESNFLIRKINFALTGISNITSPSSGTPFSNTLTVTKYGGNQIDIRLNGNLVEMRGSANGNTFLPITTENVKVTSLGFQYIPSLGKAPAGVVVVATINGVVSTTTKYLRK